MDYSRRAQEFITTAREAQGLTTEELGKRAGLPPSTIKSNFQRGSLLAVDYLIPLCKALNIKPEYVIQVITKEAEKEEESDIEEKIDIEEDTGIETQQMADLIAGDLLVEFESIKSISKKKRILELTKGLIELALETEEKQ